MKRVDRNNAYKIAIETTTPTFQAGIAIEEMSELTKELLKNTLRGKDNIQQITEEIADVTLMLEDLQVMYNIKQSDIDKIVEQKIYHMLKIMEQKRQGKPLSLSSHQKER